VNNTADAWGLHNRETNGSDTAGGSMDMEQHVKVLGIAHIVYGAFGLLIGFFLGLFLLLITSFGGALPAIMLVILPVLLIFLMVFTLPGITGGIGLLKHKPWARILILIVGFIDLLNFPLGTALGVYTIWVLMNRETEVILDRGNHTQVVRR
jgi:hypothetical protein